MMPEVNIDEAKWRGDGILSGENDPEGEVARTEQQGFGQQSTAPVAAGDAAPPAPASADGAAPRGPGRPRNPPSDGPKERTKSVRVVLPLPVYFAVKMMSYVQERSPGAIIAEMVEANVPPIGDRKADGE